MYVHQLPFYLPGQEDSKSRVVTIDRTFMTYMVELYQVLLVRGILWIHLKSNLGIETQCEKIINGTSLLIDSVDITDITDNLNINELEILAGTRLISVYVQSPNEKDWVLRNSRHPWSSCLMFDKEYPYDFKIDLDTEFDGKKLKALKVFFLCTSMGDEPICIHAFQWQMEGDDSTYSFIQANDTKTEPELHKLYYGALKQIC